MALDEKVLDSLLTYLFFINFKYSGNYHLQILKK